MQTAISLPDAELDDQDRRFLEHIKEHEWFDTHVFDAEGDLPSFSYSTGFWFGRCREMIDELRLTVRPHDASAAWASAQLGPFATPACSSET